MTKRQFHRAGGKRCELHAAARRLLAYHEWAFQHAVNCQVPEHKRMYFRFARNARNEHHAQQRMGWDAIAAECGRGVGN